MERNAPAPSRPGRAVHPPWRSLTSAATLAVPTLGALVGVLALGADEPELGAIAAAVGLGWFGHAVAWSGSSRRLRGRLAAERCSRRGLEERVAELEGLSALRGLALTGGAELDSDVAADLATADLASWTALLGAGPESAVDLFAQAFGAPLESSEASPADALPTEAGPGTYDR